MGRGQCFLGSTEWKRDGWWLVGAAIAGADEEEFSDDGGYVGGGRSRQRAWQRIKYWRRRIAQVGCEEGRELGKSGQLRAPSQSLPLSPRCPCTQEDAAAAAAAERAATEAAADEARGPPPKPSRALRVPHDCVGDMLMVWEFSQAFGGILQVGRECGVGVGGEDEDEGLPSLGLQR